MASSSSSSGGGGGGVGNDYQIYVLGQVVNPGTYHVGPSIRVAEAVNMAGGADKSGSMRSIQLREAGGKIRQVDLFNFLQNGDLKSNPFIEDNDVVFVPYIESTVRIEGPVKKPGVYELVNEQSVEDVVKLAGGFTMGASEKGEVVIVRYLEDQKNLIKIPNQLADLEKTPIRKGDIIVIPHIFTKNKKFDYNIGSLPFDNVFYPTSNENIFVVGAVTQGGAQAYNPNLGVQDYINIAGPTPLARISGSKIMMADGQIRHRTKKYILSPGDTIIVPEKKITVSNILSIYSTFTSTLFSGVALKALIDGF